MKRVPKQMLNVGLKFVPEIALSKPQKILSGETPDVGMIRGFSARKARVHDRRAAERSHKVGQRYVVPTRRF
jgi:hypothetical protein